MKKTNNFNQSLTGILVLIVFFSLTLFISHYFPNVLAQDTLTYADGWYNKGNDLLELGDYNGAIAQYDKVLAVDPMFEKALISKGLALGSLGNYAETITYYDKALAANPNNADAAAFKKDALDSLNGYWRWKGFDIDLIFLKAPEIRTFEDSKLPCGLEE